MQKKNFRAKVEFEKSFLVPNCGSWCINKCSICIMSYLNLAVPSEVVSCGITEYQTIALIYWITLQFSVSHYPKCSRTLSPGASTLAAEAKIGNMTF